MSVRFKKLMKERFLNRIGVSTSLVFSPILSLIEAAGKPLFAVTSPKLVKPLEDNTKGFPYSLTSYLKGT